nr:hypothetical protein [Tanacetum cinerariifolium]
MLVFVLLRAMTTIGEVNERVTDLAISQRQNAQELYVHCKDEQDDRALLRAQVSLVARERRFVELVRAARDPEPRDGPADAGSSC